MAFSILVFLFTMEPLITLMVLILAGIGAGGFIIFTQKKIKEYGAEELDRRRKMIQAVNQGLGGIKSARVLNREEEFINRYSTEARNSTRLLAFVKFIQQIPKPIVETTAVIGMMAISGIMVWQGRPMSAIIPTLTLFAMALVRLMPSVQQLSSMYTNLQYNMVSIDPIYDHMKILENYRKEFSADRSSGKTLTINESIVVDDISFKYPNSDDLALDHISVEIPKGSAVAFVGESGAGKTTIVDLLLGLVEPLYGTISVDGHNIQHNLSAWQTKV
jgi:ATP-binding cassette subfamily C protein